MGYAQTILDFGTFKVKFLDFGTFKVKFLDFGTFKVNPQEGLGCAQTIQRCFRARKPPKGVVSWPFLSNFDSARAKHPRKIRNFSEISDFIRNLMKFIEFTDLFGSGPKMRARNA